MTLSSSTYVIARNKDGRPTLQHKLLDGTARHTGCGRDMSGWSRHYTNQRIETILCKQPGCRS